MSTLNRCQHHLHWCYLEGLQVSELWSWKDSRSFLMGFLRSLAKVHSSPSMWCWQKHAFPSFAYAFCKFWINVVLYLLREWYQWGVESDASTECRQRSGTYSYTPFFVYMSWYKEDLLLSTQSGNHTHMNNNPRNHYLNFRNSKLMWCSVLIKWQTSDMMRASCVNHSSGDYEPLLWRCGAIHVALTTGGRSPDCPQPKEKEKREEDQEG